MSRISNFVKKNWKKISLLPFFLLHFFNRNQQKLVKGYKKNSKNNVELPYLKLLKYIRILKE